MVNNKDDEPEKSFHNGNGNGRFVKGDPRINKGGRGKGKTGFATLLKEMGKLDHKDGKTKMQAVCEKLYELALNGDSWAITALMDRTDGKPRQVMEMLDTHRDIGSMGDEELTALFRQNSQEN